MQLLLLEDDEATREGLALLLEWVGARVHGVASVADAWQAFGEVRFDAILSDLILLRENGCDFIRRVRREAKADVFAIAITGVVREHDREEALHAGFDDFLQKPVQVEDIISKLQQRR